MTPLLLSHNRFDLGRAMIDFVRSPSIFLLSPNDTQRVWDHVDSGRKASNHVAISLHQRTVGRIETERARSEGLHLLMGEVCARHGPRDVEQKLERRHIA